MRAAAREIELLTTTPQNPSMEAPPKGSRRTGLVALGIVAIVAAVLWTLLWGTVALAASAFGGDTRGWVVVSGALALGLFVFVFGVSVVRGRPPNRWGWLAVTAAVLALLALPLGSWSEDREAAPVNRAVQRSYMERSGLENVKADCDMFGESADGSELGMCTLENSTLYDICDVEIRRKQELIASTDISDCLSGRFKR